MCFSGTTVTASGSGSSDLQRAFNVIDSDHDGLISSDDLRYFFSFTYHDNDDELIGAMIAVADSNGDGLVDFREFERMILKMEGGRRKNGEISGSSRGGAGVMEEAFRLMDTDGDGRLSHGDLKRFMMSSGLDASDEDVSSMMGLAGGDDPAARGVSFDEFLSILTGYDLA